MGATELRDTINEMDTEEAQITLSNCTPQDTTRTTVRYTVNRDSVSTYVPADESATRRKDIHCEFQDHAGAELHAGVSRLDGRCNEGGAEGAGEYCTLDLADNNRMTITCTTDEARDEGREDEGHIGTITIDTDSDSKVTGMPAALQNTPILDEHATEWAKRGRTVLSNPTTCSGNGWQCTDDDNCVFDIDVSPSVRIYRAKPSLPYTVDSTLSPVAWEQKQVLAVRITPPLLQCDRDDNYCRWLRDAGACTGRPSFCHDIHEQAACDDLKPLGCLWRVGATGNGTLGGGASGGPPSTCARGERLFCGSRRGWTGICSADRSRIATNWNKCAENGSDFSYPDGTRRTEIPPCPHGYEEESMLNVDDHAGILDICDVFGNEHHYIRQCKPTGCDEPSWDDHGVVAEAETHTCIVPDRSAAGRENSAFVPKAGGCAGKKTELDCLTSLGRPRDDKDFVCAPRHSGGDDSHDCASKTAADCKGDCVLQWQTGGGCSWDNATGCSCNPMTDHNANTHVPVDRTCDNLIDTRRLELDKCYSTDPSAGVASLPDAMRVVCEAMSNEAYSNRGMAASEHCTIKASYDTQKKQGDITFYQDKQCGGVCSNVQHKDDPAKMTCDGTLDLDNAKCDDAGGVWNPPEGGFCQPKIRVGTPRCTFSSRQDLHYEYSVGPTGLQFSTFGSSTPDHGSRCWGAVNDDSGGWKLDDSRTQAACTANDGTWAASMPAIAPCDNCTCEGGVPMEDVKGSLAQSIESVCVNIGACSGSDSCANKVDKATCNITGTTYCGVVEGGKNPDKLYLDDPCGAKAGIRQVCTGKTAWGSSAVEQAEKYLLCDDETCTSRCGPDYIGKIVKGKSVEGAQPCDYYYVQCTPKQPPCKWDTSTGVSRAATIEKRGDLPGGYTHALSFAGVAGPKFPCDTKHCDFSKVVERRYTDLAHGGRTAGWTIRPSTGKDLPGSDDSARLDLPISRHNLFNIKPVSQPCDTTVCPVDNRICDPADLSCECEDSSKPCCVKCSDGVCMPLNTHYEEACNSIKDDGPCRDATGCVWEPQIAKDSGECSGHALCSGAKSQSICNAISRAVRQKTKLYDCTWVQNKTGRAPRKRSWGDDKCVDECKPWERGEGMTLSRPLGECKSCTGDNKSIGFANPQEATTCNSVPPGPTTQQCTMGFGTHALGGGRPYQTVPKPQQSKLMLPDDRHPSAEAARAACDTTPGCIGFDTIGRLYDM